MSTKVDVDVCGLGGSMLRDCALVRLLVFPNGVVAAGLVMLVAMCLVCQ